MDDSTVPAPPYALYRAVSRRCYQVPYPPNSGGEFHLWTLGISTAYRNLRLVRRPVCVLAGAPAPCRDTQPYSLATFFSLWSSPKTGGPSTTPKGEPIFKEHSWRRMQTECQSVQRGAKKDGAPVNPSSAAPSSHAGGVHAGARAVKRVPWGHGGRGHGGLAGACRAGRNVGGVPLTRPNAREGDGRRQARAPGAVFSARGVHSTDIRETSAVPRRAGLEVRGCSSSARVGECLAFYSSQGGRSRKKNAIFSGPLYFLGNLA